MSLRRTTSAAFVGVTFASLVLGAGLLSGCAASRVEAQAGASETPELPGWVRIVVPTRDGRSLFVGGASFAATPEEGVVLASADAGSQIEAEARRRFTTKLSLATSQSGVETTAMERLDLRNRVADAFADRMVAAAVSDSVYYRRCGEAEGTAGAGSAGPVCQIFVLLSLPEEAWETGFVDILETEKRRTLEEGDTRLGSLVEWLMRHTLEQRPEGGRERSR